MPNPKANCRTTSYGQYTLNEFGHQLTCDCETLLINRRVNDSIFYEIPLTSFLDLYSVNKNLRSIVILNITVQRTKYMDNLTTITKCLNLEF